MGITNDHITMTHYRGYYETQNVFLNTFDIMTNFKNTSTYFTMLRNGHNL